MPALARPSSTQHPTHRTAEPERRRSGADRRSMWRGSRRNGDWIMHLERESADGRERIAGRMPSFSGPANESHTDTR